MYAEAALATRKNLEYAKCEALRMTPTSFTCTFLGNHFNDAKKCWVPNGTPLEGIAGETVSDWTRLLSFITEDRRSEDKGKIKLFIPGKLFDDALPNDKGSTLINENIEHLSFIAIDIEGGGTPDKPASLLTDEDLIGINEHLSKLPFETVFFNSYSDNQWNKGRRGRILVPLAEPICPSAIGIERKAQGRWWSHFIFIPLIEHIIGPWVRHPGIRAGLEGAKLFCGKYYLRSAPLNATDTWLVHNNPGTFFNPTEIIKELAHKADSLTNVASQDVTGVGIPPSKIKRILKTWQNADSIAENKAAVSLAKVLKGEKESEPGAGFDTNNNLCRLLVQYCYPFDPKVVAAELFSKSCEAWARTSKQSLDWELAYVETNLKHWLDVHVQNLEKKANKPAWTKNLSVTKEGIPKSTGANVASILDLHPDLEGVFGYDERSCKVCLMKAPPFPYADCNKYPCTVDIDAVSFALIIWLRDRTGLEAASSEMVAKNLPTLAQKIPFDPIKDYFGGLEWDGVARLDTWLIDHAGAEDNLYTRLVSSKWMIAAVARAFKPGCQVDNLLILEGAQGVGKSSLFRTLCKNPEWFTDTLPDLHNKEAALQLNGKLLIEVSELNTIKRSTNTDMKRFFSCTSDTYRAPYERTTKDVPRRCVFCGTTNEKQYTADATGARRFWPVAVGKESIDIKAIKQNRDLLWAEATSRFFDGEPWWLDNDQNLLAKQEQKLRRQEDMFEHSINEAIEAAETKPFDTLNKQKEAFDTFNKTTLTIYQHPEYGDVVLKNDLYNVLELKKDAHSSTLARVHGALKVLGWIDGPRLKINKKRYLCFVQEHNTDE
jgi:predicted P-loop ATPase